MISKIKTLGEMKDYCRNNGCTIGFSENSEVFGKSRSIGDLVTANSLAVLPMEGCDAEHNGAPGELTKRRYERFAKSGAGLIWFEAIAVVEEGRASQKQLFIHKDNVKEFSDLTSHMRLTCEQKNGFHPILIAQLTHSGRYSKPFGIPAPIIASHNPELDEKYAIAPDYPLVDDETLAQLEDRFVDAALLAQKAGFDGVDIKASHGYLLSELMGSHLRGGEYGGSYENRTRLLKNVVRKIRAATGSKFILGVRLSIYDAIQYQFGFGVDKTDPSQWDPDEPKKLIKELYDLGVRMIAVTMGNPYFNPHINRPYEKGFYTPPELPLKSVERHITLTGEVKKSVPDMVFVGAGYSWLRQYALQAGAYSLENGLTDMVGFGRLAFAYPNFANDILHAHALDRSQVCTTCSKCTYIMRNGGPAGCVVRDSKIYAAIYKKIAQEKATQ